MDPPPPTSSITIPIEAVKSLLQHMAMEVARTLDAEIDGQLLGTMVDAVVALHLKSPRDPRRQPPAEEKTPEEKEDSYHQEMQELQAQYPWLDSFIDSDDQNSTQSSVGSE